MVSQQEDKAIRVLIAFPNDGETGNGLVEAFKERGHDVDHLCATRHPYNLYSQMCKGGYEFVLMSRTIGLYPGFVRAKMKYPDTKFAIWNVDIREKIEEWGLLVNFIQEVDYYFVVASGVVKKWSLINPNTYFVPQGLQKERYHPVCPTDEQLDKYKCDVSFIGNLSMPEIHKERAGILHALEDSRFDFKHLTGVYGGEHNAAVASAMISLGVTHSPHISHYVSVRDWKIMGAGGILLEQSHPGINDLTRGYAHQYVDAGDCIDQVGKILCNLEEEKKKARECAEWVLSSQCYVHRAEMIEGIICG